MIRRSKLVRWGWTLSLLSFQSLVAAEPTAKQALSLTPMQQDVEYDTPPETQIEQCQIRPEKDGERRAWVVSSPDGSLLRRFADTNGDNKIDQWCYYRGGVEVYRDIDANFNEKADQYRWFNTGGMRWGLDKNEDGRIDDWKWISPEETTAELVRAVRDQDAPRFTALLISAEELQGLGLPENTTQQIRQQVQAASEGFAAYAKEQTSVRSGTRWVDFSAPTPGVVASANAASEGIVVYENVIAMTETDGKHDELQAGTLVSIDQRWRLIGLPSATSAGFFFRVADPRPTALAGGEGEGVDPKVQELVQQLETLDQQLAKDPNPAGNAGVYQKRVDILRQMIALSKEQDRDMWVTQLVDAVIASAQTPEGTTDVGALEKLVQELEADKVGKEAAGQAKFAYLTAAYSDSLQKPNANLAKIQDKWIEDLKTFVAAYPGTRPASEAMLQLAISEEFAGGEDEAIRWYTEIVRDFPGTDMAEKGAGAVRRLKSVGQPLELRGKNLAGKAFDVSELRGNVVLVHYWATWCEPCKQDMLQLKKLLAQYGRSRFAVVGVNLDDQPRAALEVLQKEKMGWAQLHEAGGLESGLAKQMGVFTLPVMLLVDEKGNVVNRAVTVAELETELQKRLKTSRK